MNQIILDIANDLILDENKSFGGVSSFEFNKWTYEDLSLAITEDKFPLATDDYKYIFVSFPLDKVPAAIFTTFYEIQLRGYVPIIVNAERATFWRENPNVLYELVKRGALVQVSVSSIIKESNRKIRKFAIELCKHNLIHLLSSSKGLDELKVSKYLERKISFELLIALKRNERHIVQGTDFHVLQPKRFKD